MHSRCPGLLVNFETFSTDAILLSSVDVFRFDKTIKATKNGLKVSVYKRPFVVHRVKEKIGQIRKFVLTSKYSQKRENQLVTIIP